MNASLFAMATVLAIAAVFVAFWSVGRAGKQLRFVRRLTAIPRARAVARHRSAQDTGDPLVTV